MSLQVILTAQGPFEFAASLVLFIEVTQMREAKNYHLKYSIIIIVIGHRGTEICIELY